MFNLKIFNANLGVIIIFGCPNANFDLEWYARKYIDYMFKMILLHPNLATNAKVVFKLCSILISTITYLASKT